MTQARVARHIEGSQVSSYDGNDRETAGKRAVFEQKIEKIAVTRLYTECQKIPPHGSMATLRPFHFWEKPGFKS